MKSIAAIVMILVFLVELYLATAGSQHRKKKLLKGWNRTRGTIRSIEKVQDNLGASRKTYMELTMIAVFVAVLCGNQSDTVEACGVECDHGNDQHHQYKLRNRQSMNDTDDRIVSVTLSDRIRSVLPIVHEPPRPLGRLERRNARHAADVIVIPICSYAVKILG